MMGSSGKDLWINSLFALFRKIRGYVVRGWNSCGDRLIVFQYDKREEYMAWVL